MPKSLTLAKARPLLNSLFPSSRLTVTEDSGLKLVYFFPEAEAKFSGPTWESILRLAQLEALQEDLSK